MTILDHPARTEAGARGDLAEFLTDLAGELAFLVRTEGREAIGAWFADHDLVDGARVTAKTRAFMIALAARIPVDTSPADQLAWVTWDEYGRPLPGVEPVLPPDTRPAPASAAVKVWEDCGTYKAYERHKRRGEDAEPCGCGQAARDWWNRRYARRVGKAAPESRRDERVEAYAGLRREGASITTAAEQLRPPVSARQAQRWETWLRDEGRAPWRADNKQENADAAA